MLSRLIQRVRIFASLPEADTAEGKEERNYRNLLINGAWFGPIDGGIFNYLPVFFARLGASPSIIGMLTSGPALLGMLAYIPGGAYAERKSDLVKLGIWTAFIVRLAYPLLALLPFILPQSQIPVAVVVIWSVFSIPNAVYIPSWTTVMQQAVPPRRRANLNGTRWALFSLVSGLSILAFGFMLDHTAFPGGYQFVFLASFIAAIFNLYYYSKVKVPPFRRVGTLSAGQVSLLWRLRTFFSPLAESKAFARYNAATLPWKLASSLPIALFSVYWVNNLHASNTWIGLRGTAGYAALVVGYRAWGKIANRIGHRNILLIAGAASALYPLLTVLAPSAPWLLPAAVIWGLSISGTDIGTFDMLLACCPDGRQPSFAATSNMLTSVTTFVAPVLGGLLAQTVSVQAALLAAAALQLTTTAFFMLLPGRQEEALSH